MHAVLNSGVTCCDAHVACVEMVQQGSRCASNMYNLPVSDRTLDRNTSFWKRSGKVDGQRGRAERKGQSQRGKQSRKASPHGRASAKGQERATAVQMADAAYLRGQVGMYHAQPLNGTSSSSELHWSRGRLTHSFTEGGGSSGGDSTACSSYKPSSEVSRCPKKCQPHYRTDINKSISQQNRTAKTK